MSENKTLLFMNTPISSENDDVIGIGTYVDKLSAAIDSDAQLIAVTSPFGAGKTSIIEVLRARRESKKERIIEISMWTHLSSKKEDHAIDLHRSFLYHLVSQINPKRGTYVNRRLNPEYGVLGMHISKKRYWCTGFLAILFAILCWLISTYPKIMGKPFSWITKDTQMLQIGFFILAVALGLITIILSDIIFLNRKKDAIRKIDTDEIIDLYHMEVIKPRKTGRWEFIREIFQKSTHYIVVIDDLDRTADSIAVIYFLKELRKYCISLSQTSIKCKNKVTFVVNIKPESILLLNSDNEDGDGRNSDRETDYEGSLYPKIFDFVINLQTVNIDNYDVILEGLLKEKITQLRKVGLNPDQNHVMESIPGMQWIIRGDNLGIREIKERLNITFSIYESLIQKVPAKDVSIETCAAVAYLTTAFEKDFYQMKGHEFGNLIDLHLLGSNPDPEEYKKFMPNASTDYVNAVWELIDAEIINTSYRTYFYNYPKNSKFYTSDELCVMNAILNGTRSPNLEATAGRLLGTDSVAMKDAFYKVEQLKIQLPEVVFDSENLYLGALRLYPNGVIRKLRALDYSSNGTEKTIRFCLKLLSFDQQRLYYSFSLAQDFCEVWEEKFKETELLKLRKKLCEEFPDEIRWYQSLFFGEHSPITEEEMEQLSLDSSLVLINRHSQGFSIEHVAYVVNRYKKETNKTAYYARVMDFMSISKSKLGNENCADQLLEFMISSERIVPEFEEAVYDEIVRLYDDAGTDIDEEDDFEERADTIFDKYQCLINQVSANGNLEKSTLENISSQKRTKGYANEVATQLFDNGYFYSYVLLATDQGTYIPLEDVRIIESVLNNRNNLYSVYDELFLTLRKRISKLGLRELEKYKTIFNESFPIMSQEELDSIANGVDGNKSDHLVMSLIPQSLVTMDHVEMLVNYFNRKKHLQNTTVDILEYIAGLDSDVANKCFFCLDFDKVQYRSISAERRSRIKSLFENILSLDTPKGKVEFMKQTRNLEPDWERSLIPELKSDETLRKSYIDVVNSSDKISKFTETTLLSLGTIYAMSPIVTDVFFSTGHYSEYVSSKTMWDKGFTMETGDRRDVLWSTYIEVFSSPNRMTTRGYMVKNTEFLNRIMSEHAYEDMSDDAMMQLCRIHQDAACVKSVIDRGEEFALKYYSTIGGFKDRPAEKAFLDIVGENSTLLKSEELYEHTHPMLENPHLKGRYTKLRKNNYQTV